MSRSDREGRLPREGAVLPPRGKTEGVCQIGKIRIRFTLRRTYSCAALSVICFANASSPKGRAEKPVRTAHLINQGDCDADLLARCSFRHGLRRATFLREEGVCLVRFNLSLPLGEMSRSDKEGRLPREGAVLPPRGKTEGVCQIGKIRIRFTLRRTCSRAALSVICFANTSSPRGRAEKPVRTVHLINQEDCDTDLLARCSFRHGLRRATFLREEGLVFPILPQRRAG